MLQKLALAMIVLMLGGSAALAAPATGKVAVVAKQHVCIVLSAKPEAWMKKGGYVRALGGRCTIVNVAPDTLCIQSSNAAKAKVGASVTLEKPRAGAAGC